MPVYFHYPEFFLLIIPLALAFKQWGWRSSERVTTALRLVTALMLLLALTGPEVNLGGQGLDVIVVVDRSRSMTDEASENAVEVMKNLEKNRSPGDRLGIVSFGSSAELERLPSEQALFASFERELSADGSDLNSAILTALSLVDGNRPARVLVLSDGEFNGADPRAAGRRARELGVPVDYRAYDRLQVGDVAVETITLPRSIPPRQRFQFSVRIISDREAAAKVEVTRDGEPVETREVKLFAGVNNVDSFRDVLEQGGFYTYQAKVKIENDPIPENNQGTGVVRVESGPKLLVLSNRPPVKDPKNETSNLVKALRGGKIDVTVAEAKTHPLTQDALDPYRAVILENVPAKDLGRLKMARLVQYVEDLGGGLLMTGGENSFGMGGFYKSPLEEVLPVSMELKEEHRKLRVAIAVVLDQSGSMKSQVQGGLTKMDLANQGTSEVVKLLSKIDMVSVITVNTQAHIVQELTKVETPAVINSRVSEIVSQGGGIHVYEALEAAGEELQKAEGFQTRHIILFSDANDSVREGRYQDLLKTYQDQGITVSVIGLGRETDAHAPLLKDIAERGGGQTLFTDDPNELPRLFSQETMSVAGGTFIKKDPQAQPRGISGELLEEPARLMGKLDFGSLPRTDGYNLTYQKPDAVLMALSTDEYTAPWASFWERGLGRASVLTMEVSGEYTGEWGRWKFYEDFLVTQAQWLMGAGSVGDVFIDLERQGQDAVVTVELDPQRQQGLARKPPKLFVVPPGLEREKTVLPDFQWIGPYLLRARFRMDQLGTYRMLVQSENGQLTRGPAITLPYSPEYAPRLDSQNGRQLLAQIAELSGGSSRTDVLSILADPPRSARMMPLLPYLLMAALIMWVTEIAGRRLSLWNLKKTDAPDAATDRSMDPELGYRQRWFSRKQKAPKEPVVQEATETLANAPRKKNVNQVYAKAKQRARDRRNEE